MATVGDVLKRVLVGRQVSSAKLEHTLLPKVLALPVFSSDALSSVAYATEEIMIVLVLAGASFSFVFPIAVAIASLMTIVVISYRQTVRAYPSGGGAYIVSRENLGILPGLVAAAALLTDYVLTVSVSVAAGVFAITSAAPELAHLRVPISLGFVIFVTLMNLRGVRESGTLFAVPTYAFIGSIFVMITAGLFRCLSSCPVALPPEGAIEAVAGVGSVGLFVILRAFSSGSTALTGVEAISNGVPAFRRPQARNAAETLAIMGVISIAMFLGISWLAVQIHGVTPSEQQSIVSQIAHAVFGGGIGFYLVQIFTAAILILAANTAYQDFPRLSAILARDSFVPRQFQNRGDRLVFSNGIIVLATLAGLLLWAFDADVTRLIQLYVVGVFTSFTLSQTGMVRHWFKERSAGWRRSAIINGIGAVATGVVLVVIASTKFSHGAWIVIAAMPFIVAFFYLIHRHYERVRQVLARGAVRVGDVGSNRVLLVVTEVDAAAAEALGYVRSIRPVFLEILYVGKLARPEAERRWNELDQSVPPLSFLEGRASLNAIIERIRAVPREERDFVTVVIPELFIKRSLLQALLKPLTFRLKVSLLSEPQVVIADVPVLAEHGELVGVDGRPLIPERVEALVFVASVHDATVRAINYAQSLNAHETRAIFLATEPEETPGFLAEWAERGIGVRLDIVEAPFRDLGPPLLEEVRRATSHPGTVAAVVLPEFLVTRWWHRLLHNNRALFIKRNLLFEPRVILSSVPFQLGGSDGS